MQRTTSTPIAAWFPVVVVPFVLVLVLDQVLTIHDFIRGFLYGVGIVLMVGFLVVASTRAAHDKRLSDERRLDALTPLPERPRDED